MHLSKNVEIFAEHSKVQFHRLKDDDYHLFEFKVFRKICIIHI